MVELPERVGQTEQTTEQRRLGDGMWISAARRVGLLRKLAMIG